MEFIDLKAQYRALQDEINANIQKVLLEGRYIGGPEIKELEGAVLVRRVIGKLHIIDNKGFSGIYLAHDLLDGISGCLIPCAQDP